MTKVYDSLRRRSVEKTAEEVVRQWFIEYLKSDAVKVPPGLMNSEVGFRLGEKKYRADIMIWDRDARRLAVVECKRPEVKLSAEVLDQAVRYNIALDVKWLFLTNGKCTYALKKIEGNFVPQDKMPTYEEMLAA